MQTSRILWGALFASTFVYLAVLLVLARPSSPDASAALLLPIFGALAIGSTVASFVVPALLHRQGIARAQWPTKEVPAPDASMIQGRPSSTVRVMADPAHALAKAHRIFQTPFIFGMAMAESVAIFGLVLGMLGHPLTAVIPFFLVCWALMAGRFPTDRRVTAPVEAATGARFVAAGG